MSTNVNYHKTLMGNICGIAILSDNLKRHKTSNHGHINTWKCQHISSSGADGDGGSCDGGGSSGSGRSSGSGVGSVGGSNGGGGGDCAFL